MMRKDAFAEEVRKAIAAYCAPQSPDVRFDTRNSDPWLADQMQLLREALVE
jgi:hypothetical protein